MIESHSFKCYFQFTNSVEIYKFTELYFQTQFVIIIVYMSTLLIAKCEVPKTLTLLLFIQGVTFLILFTNFYIRSYVVKNKAAQQNGIHETDVKKVK